MSNIKVIRDNITAVKVTSSKSRSSTMTFDLEGVYGGNYLRVFCEDEKDLVILHIAGKDVGEMLDALRSLEAQILG